jgi:peptide/nickel transport system substrate-binding protein
VANIYDARTLDPIVQNEVATSGMCLHIYDTLLALDQENNLVPMLAEKWEQIDDVTYKFTLRKGVKFHNGEPFSAKDVKYTVERAQTPVGSAIRQYSEVVDKVEIVDDYTVIFKLKAPFTPFLMSLSHTWGSIVNQKAVEAGGESYGMNPVGTGPFKFKSWNKGDRIVLERNDDYWGKKPAYKELVMRAVAESINRTIELESGAVDIAYRVPVTDIRGSKRTKS